MTASPTPFFAESAGETDHSPDAGNMVSAAVPSEEIVRDIIQGVVDVATAEPTEWSACVDDATAAVLALFAPVMAEKERRIRELAMLLDKQLGAPCEQIRHRQEADDLRAQIANLTERTRLPVIADYIEVQNHSRAMEARALAAEAALAKAVEALEPFARADRALGDELGADGTFRLETDKGYREIPREAFRRARTAYAAQIAAPGAAMEAP